MQTVYSEDPHDRGRRVRDFPGSVESRTDPQVQRILAAARSEFEQYGVRRATMDDIALRAGIGRRTL